MSHAATISVWTIYERPHDQPDHFVVRRWLAGPGTLKPDGLSQVADDLDGARGLVPGGLHRLPPCKEDDPCIVEMWI